MPRDTLAELSDESLLVLYANSDPDAARLLTGRLLPRVLGYATRLLGDRAEAEALLAGGTAPHPECEAGAAAIRTWYGQAQLFELADHDEVLTAQFLESLANPNDRDVAHRAQAAAGR